MDKIEEESEIEQPEEEAEKKYDGTKRRVLTLFLLFFPTIIVAVIPSEIKGVWLPIAIKALLAFYQFVVLKNFIDTHYGE